MDWLNDLNPRQREAAEATEGPLLILAGAGSGKTRVLVYRVAHLLTKGVAPYNILAVTFTNKAADEMKERVARLLGPSAHKVWVSTFHSLGAQILRQHIPRLGYSSNFNIYDEDDSLTMIKQVMRDKDISDEFLQPKRIRHFIETVKRDILPLEDKEHESSQARQMKSVFQEYQQRLFIANAVDFGDLLVLLLRLFEEHPEVLEHYQERFRYILVDEYQDTNRVQYLIVRRLAAKYKNLCVVGDEDQSIYGWRGANIQNILNFSDDFPEARTIKLEQNYRSTKMIIEAASGLIGNNQARTPKELWTENPRGDLVRVRCMATDRDEAHFVTEDIMRLRTKGLSLSDVAIFYRTHAQSRQFEDQLRGMNIAHAVFGGIRFYDRKEIKDVIAYLKVASNPRDDVSLLRMINVPARGVGAKALETIRAEANSRGIPQLEAVRLLLKEKKFGRKTAEGLTRLVELIDDLNRRGEAGEEKVSTLVQAVIEDSEYKLMLEEEHTIESMTRLENLDELINAAAEYAREAEDPSLQGFLEKVSLYSDIDSFGGEQGQVTLMTIHTAKGLEFPVVFMVGMEENLFPHIRSIVENDVSQMEEERRLCYVGMTRAKQNLILSYALERSTRGQFTRNEPSRFLDEIPTKYLKKEGIEPHRKLKGIGQPPWSRSRDFGDSQIEYDSPPASPGSAEIWDQSSETTYRLGMKVSHPIFGVGVIVRIHGREGEAKLSIQFKKGIKKIALGHVILEPVKGS